MKQAELLSAFSQFEHVSEQLAASYRDLQQEVVQLTSALSLARSEKDAQLAEAERLNERLKRLLELLPAGVVVLGPDGTVEQFNPSAEALLGPITRGERWFSVATRAFRPAADDGHDLSLANGRRVHLETTALTGADAESGGQIVMLTDVTRTRALQDELARHKRLSAKTEMAAALAHQVRTPLATALLYAGQVRMQLGPNGDELAKRLTASLCGLETLVDDMLLFARGGAIEVAVLPLARVVDALREATDAFYAQTGYLVEIDGRVPEVFVRVNLATLVNVLMNLVRNAEEVAPAPGTDAEVESDATPDMTVRIDVDHWVTLAFADHGPGVPVEVRETLFEPFVTRSKKAGKVGSGLGLPVARSVLRSLGGELELDENYLEGARFIAHLPLVKDDPKRAQSSAEAEADDDNGMEPPK